MEEELTDDTQKLLDIATSPLPPRPAPARPDHESMVTEFLRDQQIEVGATVGIPVASLYALYLHWNELLTEKRHVVPPVAFARWLTKARFKRGRLRRGITDKRPLLLKQACARRLIEWELENKSRCDAALQLLKPSTRWNRHVQAPAAREAP